MSDPLISIIMPSFNQRIFIEETVENILSQDYSRIELVISDGASTDDTVSFMEQWAVRDDRIRFFSEPDNGPAQALNRSLERANGPIIGWLNADDLYTKGAISRAVTAFAEHTDWLMCYGHGQHIDEKGKILGLYPTLRPEVSIDHFKDGCFICQPTMFFRKTAYTMLGSLDVNLKTSFDFEYWLRAFDTFQSRIGFIDQLQAQSRLHDECITRSNRERVAIEAIQVVGTYFDQAPIHWLTTCAEELRRQYPSSPKQFLTKIQSIIAETEQFLSKQELQQFKQQLHQQF